MSPGRVYRDGKGGGGWLLEGLLKGSGLITIQPGSRGPGGAVGVNDLASGKDMFGGRRGSCGVLIVFQCVAMFKNQPHF